MSNSLLQRKCLGASQVYTKEWRDSGLDIGLPDIACKAYCDYATRERILVAEFDYLLNRNYANGL